MNFPHLSVLRRGVIVSSAVLAVAVPVVASGAAGASGPLAGISPAKGAATSAAAAHHKHAEIFTDENGNTVEMIDPGQSSYIPDVAAASDGDVAKARQILAGVQEFCRTHSVKHIKAHWSPGGMGGGMHMKAMQPMTGMSGMHMAGMRMKGMQMDHTHWFNPNR